MKSKIVQMGLSNESHEDLTEHIVIMCDREFIMQSNLRVYHPVELSNGTNAETLAKARAVLAENADVASASRDLVEKPNYETTEADVLLVELINVLEGACDE